MNSGIITILALLVNMIAVVISLLAYLKVEKVHKATNSMKDELVRVTAVASLAEGIRQGIVMGLKQASDEVGKSQGLSKE